MNKPRGQSAKKAKESVFVTVCRQVFQAQAVAAIAVLSLIVLAGAFQHSAASRRNTQLERAIQTDRAQIAAMEQQLPEATQETESLTNESAASIQEQSEGAVQSVADGTSDRNRAQQSRASAETRTNQPSRACTSAKQQAQASRQQALSLENIYHESQLAEIRKLPLIGSITELLVGETERHLSKVQEIEQIYLRALQQLSCS